ncbi:MAG: carboxypeptidase-like regulatory domain-containing protein [Flavobacteriaceae bacterium]|nr:carboxypeptidase-like regulatory domain-containing protein [Flavobacteriaceae bacterium]MDG2503309.1 carboxypeptidase-like regulatory domain-containing protein [Flavobacteriaceae bacterium]
MENKSLLLLSCCILSLFLSLPLGAQTFVIGQVIDAATKEPLPYVNIGLLNKNIGTVSDETGYFELEVNTEQNSRDTLRFSMIGFETKSYTLNDFINQNEIEVYLTEKSTALDEVILNSKRKNYQTKILGNKTTSKALYAAFTSNKLGNEMGFIVRARKHPMILKKFNISLVENDYGSIKFRLNIYDVLNGLPNKTLLTDNLFIETEESTGIVSLDLTPYEIILDQDFFIAIEWIEDLGPGKLYFSGGFFGAPLFAREVSQGTWEKIGTASVGMNVEVRY